MTDVVSQEPRRAPTWVWVVGGLATAVVLGLALDRGDRPTTAPPPSPSPSADALPDPGTAASPCGDVELPIVDVAELTGPTGLQLLVGGRDLRAVDVDFESRTLPWHDPGQVVMDLRRQDGRVLALLQAPCGNNGQGGGVVAAIDPETGARTVLGPGDQLLPGSPASVTQIDPTGQWRVGRVGRQPRTPVPEGWVMLAAAGPSYFVAVYPPAGGRRTPPTVGLGDPATGRLTPFGSGTPVVATERELLWTSGDCEQGCLLSRTGRDGVSTAQHVPALGCCAALSPDGRWLAFRLSRSSGRLGEHPGPPQDIAVLDLRTAQVRRLRGLVLPAKAGATLAWSPNSRWLAVGADLGPRPLVLLWTPGAAELMNVPMGSAAAGGNGPPALVVL